MTTTTAGASGADDQLASGDDQNKQKDTVRYETHLKLLDEKKRVQAENARLAAELEKVQKEREVKAKEELEQQGNYKKLLEQEREQLKKVQDDHNSLLGNIMDARKRTAVLRHISGKVPDEVVSKLLSVDGVATNEDGSINEDTAKLVAQDFEKTFPYAVLRDARAGNLPNGAASGGGKGDKITYQEWLSLKDAKEMKKRHGDVDWSTV
jgi:hypothetical protein